MNKKFLFLFLAFLLSSSFAFAETIVLKTGKTIEGKILEQNESSINVDIEGVTLTYYLDEIQSIDGKEVTPVSVKEEASPASQETNAAWEGWYGTITDYYDKLQAILNKSQEVGTRIEGILSEIQEDKDMQEHEVTTKALISLDSSIIEELKALTPPAGFKVFHQKQIEACERLKMSAQAILKKDKNSALDYFRKSTIPVVEALQELKRIYSEHSAPQEVIAEIDNQITQYSETEPQKE